MQVPINLQTEKKSEHRWSLGKRRGIWRYTFWVWKRAKSIKYVLTSLRKVNTHIIYKLKDN